MCKFWYSLIERYGRKKVILLGYLAVVVFFSLLMNLVIWKKLYHSAIFYIFIPFLISLAITLFRSYKSPKSHWQKYFSHILTAISILFSTSILIGEGFICILFFAPIYLFVVTITYLASSKTKKYGFTFSLFILAISLEGTSTPLSLPRENTVHVITHTQLSVEELMANLAKPFDLNKERNWLISVFPMPYHIDAGSLQEGDIHTVYTRYHRWFFTNTYEGKAELLIEYVGENSVRTKVIYDSTYFSTYLSGSGTEIRFDENSDGGVDVSLLLHYRRNLDPAWYFHPLQKFGVTKMAQLIMDELILRKNQNS